MILLLSSKQFVAQSEPQNENVSFLPHSFFIVNNFDKGSQRDVLVFLTKPVSQTHAGLLGSNRHFGRGFLGVRRHGSPFGSQYSFSGHFCAGKTEKKLEKMRQNSKNYLRHSAMGTHVPFLSSSLTNP